MTGSKTTGGDVARIETVSQLDTKELSASNLSESTLGSLSGSGKTESSTVQYVITTEASLPQMLGNYLFQILGLAAAVIFGAWAIKAYNEAILANQISEAALKAATAANDLSQKALQQALLANQLALLDFCMSTSASAFSEVCTDFTSGLAAALPSIAAALYPTTQTGVAGSPTTTTRSPPTATTSIIVGSSTMIGTPSFPPTTLTNAHTTSSNLPSVISRTTTISISTGPPVTSFGSPSRDLGSTVGIIVVVVIAAGISSVVLMWFCRRRTVHRITSIGEREKSGLIYALRD